MLPLTYELRPKWKNNNKNKTKSQNAVSRSDPLQGSDDHRVQWSDGLKVVNGDGQRGAKPLMPMVLAGKNHCIPSLPKNDHCSPLQLQFCTAGALIGGTV